MSLRPGRAVRADLSGGRPRRGWQRPAGVAPALLAASPSSSAASLTASSARAVQANSLSSVPIVGPWMFTLLSKRTPGIADATVPDAGCTNWHGDGSELMKSSRPPKSGDFCTGVYQQTGRSTDALNVVTPSWRPTGMAYVGPGGVHEPVTPDHAGNARNGTFTFDQYAQDGATRLA